MAIRFHLRQVTSNTSKSQHNKRLQNDHANPTRFAFPRIARRSEPQR